jgi:toxin-antitoxin system PIN domain toxin
VPGTLLDTSVWLAAAFTSHPFRRLAVGVLTQATESEPAALCRQTELSFLRLATTPTLLRVYGAEGQTNRDAAALLSAFLALPQVVGLPEPEGTRPLWLRLADRGSSSPKLWMDAYLAAFAIAGNLRLATLDSDFRAYETEGLELRLLSPPGR